MNSINKTIGLLSLIFMAALTVKAAGALNFNSNPSDISVSSTSVTENVSANTIVGILNTTDANRGDNFTYSLVAGAGDTDNAAFSISGSTLRINSSPDFEDQSSYSIRLRTTDRGGLTYEEAIIISVTDINENATSLTLIPSLIDKGAVSGTFVGMLNSNDPDPGPVFYLLTIEGDGNDDDDNDKFTIVNNYSVDGKFYVSLNQPGQDNINRTTYHIRVYYYDGIDQSFEQALTVTINNTNQNISSSGNSMNESEDSIK